MKAYIRENFKTIILITLLFICTTLFICTNELVAKRLPEISTIDILEVKLEKGDVYEYSGKEITPSIEYIVFVDEDGLEFKKDKSEISIVSYKQNINVGYADIKIGMLGYQGTKTLKDIFAIRPAKVENLVIDSYSRTSIDLKWDISAEAKGYFVYRSSDNGDGFTTIADITDIKSSFYQDTDIQANVNYVYNVCAYDYAKKSILKGHCSDTVSQIVPLDTPAISSVNSIAYNTMQIQWTPVGGAVGYEIYKSSAKDGEYTRVAEILDGAAASFNDANCECGKEYFYYIKAAQLLEDKNVYGQASEIVGGRVTPNRVNISGGISQDQTQVTLSWKETPGAQGFEIFRSNANSSNYELVQKIERPDVLSWTDTGLSKNAEYKYYVRAYCVTDGQTVYSVNSNTFLKEVIIVYDYSVFAGDVSVMTQYAGHVPYVWGGKSVRGWDCSGYTYWVFKNHFGINIGTTVAQQYPKGVSVSISDRASWKPGDLLYYTEGAGPSHVAIYIGNGQLVHALSPKYGTLIQSVDYYERWDTATSLIAVKRVFQ